jgi:hypothetical protein
MSMILTASVLWPEMGEEAILMILAGGGVAAAVVAMAFAVWQKRSTQGDVPVAGVLKANWQMPPLAELPPARLSLASRLWMIVLRGYLLVAGGLVLVRIIQLAMGGGA